MSNDIGKSIVNTKYSQLVVSGENNSNYQVVVYPIINNIDLKYISTFYLYKTLFQSINYSTFSKKREDIF